MIENKKVSLEHTGSGFCSDDIKKKIQLCTKSYL